MSAESKPDIEVFYSYSHQDEALRQQLEKHLRILEHRGVITGWHDRQIGAGTEWAGQIDTHLDTARVILLLVSSDFLASNYCYNVEMKRAMERHAAGEARVIPIILRPVVWEDAPFGKLQALPKDAKPVTSWQNQDEAFVSVTKGVQDAVEGLVREAPANFQSTSPEQVPVHPPQEPEPTTVSPPKKPLVPDQKSRRVFIGAASVGLVIAAVGTYVTVPEVGEWLGLNKPREITTSIGMTLVRIPAGEFQMGSNSSIQPVQSPVHRVRISEPFYLGKYEVTQAQWKAVMGTNPSAFSDNPNQPVENVSWEDVQEFIKRLNEQEGWDVCRLPTDAQWEYAARAGTTMEWYESDVDAIAWYVKNSEGQTHEVGQKRPNAWGLYDMLGNVWEWCYDGMREYTADMVVDPMGLTVAGTPRVIRGGCWQQSEEGVRAAIRNPVAPNDRAHAIGFRCASSGRRR